MRFMSEYKQKQTKKSPDEEVEEVSTPEPQDFDITDILDEIDTVLEENAEEFVAGYIQKGGQ